MYTDSCYSKVIYVIITIKNVFFYHLDIFFNNKVEPLIIGVFCYKDFKDEGLKVLTFGKPSLPA